MGRYCSRELEKLYAIFCRFFFFFLHPESDDKSLQTILSGARETDKIVGIQLVVFLSRARGDPETNGNKINVSPFDARFEHFFFLEKQLGIYKSLARPAIALLLLDHYVLLSCPYHY